MKIVSKNNSLVIEVKKFNEKKFRKKSGRFIAEGFRFVEEALKSDFNVTDIFVCDNQLEKYHKYGFDKFINENTKLHIVSNEVIRAISLTEHPQGITAVICMKNMELSYKNGFYVLIDKIQDPGNLGTIIRTSHAAGALGVLIMNDSCDLYNDKTLRATMGSIFHVPVMCDCDMDVITGLKNNGFKIISSALKDSCDLFSTTFPEKYIITVGNEGAGVSPEILDVSDMIIKIPMPGGAESLNASAAASVIIYEGLRQRT